MLFNPWKGNLERNHIFKIFINLMQLHGQNCLKLSYIPEIVNKSVRKDTIHYEVYI